MLSEATERGMAARASTLTLDHRTFQKIQRLVHEKAGIDLNDSKLQLVSARLGKNLRKYNCSTYEEYLHKVEHDSSGESLVGLIDALTTNFTSFLREEAHFDFMRRKILPKLMRRDSVEIWCAAAATGEEPYTLLFTMLDAFQASPVKCRVLATDISTGALNIARRGIYSAERFSNVPHEWLPKYLLRGDGDYKGLYRIKYDIARLVEFRRLNLIEAFDPGRLFPLISCRNVMIYFDVATQQKVVQRLSRFLEPGGYLFVGHSEGLARINHQLRFIQPAIYQNSPATGGLK
jgi:chemotaxis protein methyltransferase CheR